MKVYSHKVLRGFADAMYHFHTWTTGLRYGRWLECRHYDIAKADVEKALKLGAKPLTGGEFSCK